MTFKLYSEGNVNASLFPLDCFKKKLALTFNHCFNKELGNYYK